MKKIGKWLFVSTFFLICIYPLIGRSIDDKFTLSGVTNESVIEAASVETIMNGTFQTSLNSWVENNFPGRGLLINIRSQLQYSLLNESPNNNVVIGQDKYLFEPGYIHSELGITTADPHYFPELINKLEALQDMLNEAGKEVYVFITPSKAYFCQDKIPNYYSRLGTDTTNNYEMFIPYLQQSDLHYFDSRAFIETFDQNENLNAPVFYPTGIHWSYSYGYSASKALSEYISAQSKWDLSTLTFTENMVDGPGGNDESVYLADFNFLTIDNYLDFPEVMSVLL